MISLVICEMGMAIISPFRKFSKLNSWPCVDEVTMVGGFGVLYSTGMFENIIFKKPQDAVQLHKSSLMY
jgi:hypothetical protein